MLELRFKSSSFWDKSLTSTLMPHMRSAPQTKQNRAPELALQETARHHLDELALLKSCQNTVHALAGLLMPCPNS
eukprot:7233936-Lingulodinium_polyedra.AAC.1